MPTGCRRRRSAGRWAAPALYALDAIAGEATTAGAYVGFIAAIVLWGWNELLFLSGLVTGPNKAACPPGAGPWARFRLAAAALAYHEVALVATGAAIAWLTWGTANQVGLCTFALLFVMRLSAKLNIFFGVPNMSEELLPSSVAHLKSYFGPRRRNGFFPASVAAVTVLVGWLVWRALDPTLAAGSHTGTSLLAALAVLGLLEHWLLVLPLPDAALWRWAMPGARPSIDGPDPLAREGASGGGNTLNRAAGATTPTGNGRLR